MALHQTTHGCSPTTDPHVSTAQDSGDFHSLVSNRLPGEIQTWPPGCLSCHRCSQVSHPVGDPRSYVSRNLMGCAGQMVGAGGGGGASPSGLPPHTEHQPGLQLKGVQIIQTRSYLPKLLCVGDIGFGERFGEPAR